MAEKIDAPVPAKLAEWVDARQAQGLYFFSREEERLHVHVSGSDGEAKFWLDPQIEIAQNHGLNPRRIAKALAVVRRKEREIRAAWEEHFGG